MARTKTKVQEVHKIIVGFVVQRFNAHTGKFLGQDFVAGDDVTWEDATGEILEEEPEIPYHSIELRQTPVVIGD